MRRIARGVVVSLVGLLASAPAALAGTVYAGPPSQFFTSSVTIDQGEAVTFTNLDFIAHDVTAQGKGPDGKPLFASALTNGGGSSPVSGTEFLTTGDYPFVCSIHPNMLGTLTVSSEGTPAPRPGSGGGSGGSSPPPAQPAQNADTEKPTVQLHLVDTRLSTIKKRKAISLHVTADEPVTVGLRAKAGKTTLGSTTVKLTQSGTQAVRLKLTSAGAKLVRRSRKLAITLSANAADGANNKSTARQKRTLRR